MSVHRPHFLISNDDGIHAPGIAHLAELLRKMGDVTLVAPDGPRSGASSQITTTLPLKLIKMRDEEGYQVYRCSGTPADCVKLALNVLFPKNQHPDLVVTGINHGRNDGICVIYSGTVGAAIEGCIAGIPSLAISVNDHGEDAEMRYAIAYAEPIVRWMLHNELPLHTLLSLNLPIEKPLGLKIAPQAVGRFMDEFVHGTNASGNPVYWMAGKQTKTEDTPDTDFDFLEMGYATLTPIRIDMTDRATLAQLEASFSDQKILL